MKTKFRNILFIFLAFIIIFPIMPVKAGASSDIHFVVNGNKLNYSETVILNGRTYVPVRQLSELLGANVVWDGTTKSVKIAKGNMNFSLIVNDKKVYYNGESVFMDSPAIIQNARSYAPIRFVAEALHQNVFWDSSIRTIAINEKKNYLVKSGDSLFTIGKENNLSINQLKSWNNLTSDEILIGQKLYLEPVKLNAIDNNTKQVFSYTQTDMDWLAKIVYAEARDEPYEGYVAVAAVVINRVESPDFPNTIYDVIFQPQQFSPVLNGTIYQVNPDQAAYNAAKAALSGEDPVEGALFFFNPRKSNSSFFSQKEFVKEVGNHDFYK